MTLNRVFEYQPIALQILTNQVARAENNLLADKKDPQNKIQVVIRIIYLMFQRHNNEKKV